MITIKNFSDVSEEKIERLVSSLNVLSVPGNFIIEIWNSARDVHSPEEIKRIQRDSPEFDPDESSGEVWDGRIRLFRLAFITPLQKTIFVAIHEIGHYVTDGDEDEADNWAKSIIPAYDLDKNRVTGEKCRIRKE